MNYTGGKLVVGSVVDTYHSNGGHGMPHVICVGFGELVLY